MFALSTVALGFALFMLALMRVFLDPKLYASQAVRRVSGDRRTAPRQEQTPAYQEQAPSYSDPFAEPFVPRYASAHIPEAVPEPAGAFTAQPYVADAQPAAPQTGPVEYQPDANPYVQPASYSAAGNAAYDIYANPYNDPLANPYAQPTQAQPIQAQPVQAQPAQSYQTDVPVLGTVPPQTQS